MAVREARMVSLHWTAGFHPCRGLLPGSLWLGWAWVTYRDTTALSLIVAHTKKGDSKERTQKTALFSRWGRTCDDAISFPARSSG